MKWVEKQGLLLQDVLLTSGSMIKFIMKIPNIIVGTWNNIFDKNKELYNTRFKICKDCEHLDTLSNKIHICDQCGCVMESKTRVLDEKCVIGKW